MKQNTKTFAQRAKELKAKYSRSEFDEIERKELTEALRKLRDEQELYRMENGLDQGENTEQFDGTNATQVLKPYTNINVAPINTTGAGALSDMYGQSASKWLTNPIKGTWRAPETSFLPTAISTGVSMLGNLFGAINARNSIPKNVPKSVSLPRVAPTNINLEPEREALNRTYNTASNVALRASRDMSSPGAAYANQVGALSTLTDSLGSGISDSYMREANTNAQMKMQSDTTNAQLGAQEALANMQLKLHKLDWDYKKGQASQPYIDNMFAAIPAGLADYRAQRSQDAFLSTYGKDNGLFEYIPYEESNYDKFMRRLSGPKYSVKNRDYVRSITQTN